MIRASVVVVIIVTILTVHLVHVECAPGSGHQCYMYTTAVPTYPYILLYRGYFRTQDVSNTCGPFLHMLHNLQASSVHTSIPSIDNRIAHPCLLRVSEYGVRDSECSAQMYANENCGQIFCKF